MVTQAPRRIAVVTALLFALSCFLLTLFVWKQLGGSGPFEPKGYRFHALFSKAGGLGTNADVRIAGVSVGRVVKITPAQERTDVTVELKPDYVPLPADARAILRQKTLLGETFIALTPGTPGAPKLADGGRLPNDQVSATQSLDEVLSTFDSRTRRAFQDLLAGVGTTLDQRGGDFNDAIGNAGPVTHQLAAIVGILDRQQPAVRSILHDGGSVLRSIADRRADVQSLVNAGDQVLATTAARDRALTGTVRALPPFLTQLRSALAVVDRVSLEAAPSLKALRPAAPLVRPALQSLITLSPEARGLLARGAPFIRSARRGLPAATHLVDTMVPLVRALFPAAREVTPVISLLAKYNKEEIATFANLGASLQATAPVGGGAPVHELRALVPITNESVTGQSSRLASNRHNPYYAPGGLSLLSQGGLLASDCNNVGNAQTIPILGTGAPPCKVQPPWTFNGESRYFPHVERASGKRR